MSKKYIILYVILAFMYIISDNLASILNNYQNIFKKRVCISSFCVNKPKNYLLISVIEKGKYIYSFSPIYPKDKPKYISRIFFTSVTPYAEKAIGIAPLEHKIAFKLIDKLKLKKVINDCYDMTEDYNKFNNLNVTFYLICPDKNIDIVYDGDKDYKTIKYILDGFSTIYKNNSKK